MSGSGVLIIGTSFLDRHSRQLTAILTLVLTFALAAMANRGVSHWAARVDLNPAVDTRVRFIRRLITLGTCLIGVLFALSQFGGLNKLAAGVLASSAIIAAIVGLAARQTLANLDRRRDADDRPAAADRRPGHDPGSDRSRRGCAPQLHRAPTGEGRRCFPRSGHVRKRRLT